MDDSFMALIAEEERHLGRNFLPYMLEYGCDALADHRLVDVSEVAARYHENHREAYPLPVIDIPDSDATFYRIAEKNLEEYFFRDEFVPQCYLIPADAETSSIPDDDYDMAVELRGTFTVEGRDGFADAAEHLADAWREEIGRIWEQYPEQTRHDMWEL